MNNPFVDNRFTNPETKQLQTWVTATIKELSSEVRLTKKKDEAGELLDDDSQTLFRQAIVEIVTPNAGIKTIDANIWEASRIANAMIFSEGKEVAAIFDLEGDYAGSVWLGLPPKRNIDLSWFGVAEEQAPAEGPKQEESKI